MILNNNGFKLIAVDDITNGLEVNLQHSQVVAVQRIAEKQGKSLSHFIAEIFDQVIIQHDRAGPNHDFSNAANVRGSLHDEEILQLKEQIERDDEKIALAKQLLNNLVVPILEEVGVALEGIQVSSVIGQLLEQEKFSDLPCYYIKFKTTCKNTSRFAKIKFMASADSCVLAARSHGRHGTTRYHQIDFSDPSIVAKLSAIVEDFIKHSS